MPVSPVGEASKGPGMDAARGCPPPPSNVDLRRQRAQPSSPSQTQGDGQKVQNTEYRTPSRECGCASIDGPNADDVVSACHSVSFPFRQGCAGSVLRGPTTGAGAERDVRSCQTVVILDSGWPLPPAWKFRSCRLHGSCHGRDVGTCCSPALSPKKGTDQTVGAAWLT